MVRGVADYPASCQNIFLFQALSDINGLYITEGSIPTCPPDCKHWFLLVFTRIFKQLQKVETYINSLAYLLKKTQNTTCVIADELATLELREVKCSYIS